MDQILEILGKALIQEIDKRVHEEVRRAGESPRLNTPSPAMQPFSLKPNFSGGITHKRDITHHNDATSFLTQPYR